MPLTPSPNPDHFGGARVRGKLRTIATKAMQSGVAITLTVLDESGRTRDLTPWAADELIVGFGERVSNVGSEVAASLEGDASGGTISFTLPDSLTATPGIWHAAVYVRDGDDNTTVLDELLVRVDRTASMTVCGGMPSIPELRLFLRDYASENELLDIVDFDDSEMTFAAALCVDQWNEALPFDGPNFTTQTFPFRYNWLMATCGHLFLIASEHYLRNQLAAQTGGISQDDKNKWQQYEQRGRLILTEWKKFVAERKTIESVNAMGDGAIGGFFG